MSYEIEQKFRTSDHAGVSQILLGLGAEAGPSIEQVDTYLNHPSRDFASTHEAFRLRSSGEVNVFTYKGPKRSGPTKTREEIEIGYDQGSENSAEMLRMLLLLGFQPVAEIRKTRVSYHLTHQGWNVEVALDEADKLGTFVEIEVIAQTKESIDRAQKVVLSLADELKLTDIESRSYLRMHLELIDARVDR